MLAELIKLSKELYELDMVEDSIRVDEMIDKLYGLGIEPSKEDFREELEIEQTLKNHSYDLYDIMQKNSLNKEFKYSLASIIYETLKPDDTREIVGLLKTYLE